MTGSRQSYRMKNKKREDECFMEMRRKDKAMEQEAVSRLLKEAEYGILATSGEDGYPYGVPMNFVYEDGKVYFHGTIANGHRNQNIASNPKACFTVVRNTEVLPEQFNTKFESVILFGTIREEKEKKEEILKKIITKYSSSFMERGMEYIAKAFDKVMTYEMTVESMSGKAKY